MGNGLHWVALKIQYYSMIYREILVEAPQLLVSSQVFFFFWGGIDPYCDINAHTLGCY